MYSLESLDARLKKVEEQIEEIFKVDVNQTVAKPVEEFRVKETEPKRKSTKRKVENDNMGGPSR